MGEREEKGKRSSLRGRVDRMRKTHEKPMNVTHLAIGLVVLALAGVGLFFAFSSGPAETAGPSSDAAPQQAQARQIASAPAMDARTEAWNFLQNVRNKVMKSDPDQAIVQLQGAIGKWDGKYDVDLTFYMAMAVDEKMALTSKSRDLFQKKLQYLQSARALVSEGGKWFHDPMGNRTENLDKSIDIAQKELGKL